MPCYKAPLARCLNALQTTGCGSLSQLPARLLQRPQNRYRRWRLHDAIGCAGKVSRESGPIRHWGSPVLWRAGILLAAGVECWLIAHMERTLHERQQSTVHFAGFAATAAQTLW